MMLVIAVFLGGGSSSSGGAASEPVVQVPNTMPSESVESDSGVVINPSCNITAIDLRPSSGTISKASSSLRALISFDYVSTSDDANQISYVSSSVQSKDGNDFIDSDPLIRSNVSLVNGKGQRFLSYNLQDQFNAGSDQYSE